MFTTIKLFFFSILPLLLAACAKPLPSQMEFVLGTVCTVNLYEGGNRQLYARIFERIREIDRTMTAHSGEFQELFTDGETVGPDSEAARPIRSATEALVSGVVAINDKAGVEPVQVRAGLIALLEKALHYAALSDGAFDPTVGPLVKLWGIGSGAEKIPAETEIAAALALVNWRDVVIDREAETVFLRREGMALDLGAIAKGYAADEAARIAAEANVKRAIFDLGGNIAALGWRGKHGKEMVPWRIGIQNPLSVRGDYIGVLPVHDKSVVTSGVYERYFESGGKRYHHLLSTTDGYPVTNGLLSVTIVTDRSTDADALSTTAFALGYERGKALIDSLPNTEAVFIFDDRSVRYTDGLAGVFSLTGNTFSVSDL